VIAAIIFPAAFAAQKPPPLNYGIYKETRDGHSSHPADFGNKKMS
jgi:hypothetical protein